MNYNFINFEQKIHESIVNWMYVHFPKTIRIFKQSLIKDPFQDIYHYTCSLFSESLIKLVG